MNFLFLSLLALSSLAADIQPQPLGVRTYRFDKVVAFSHSYIIITENVLGAQNQVIHDPDCHCIRFTEEQIAKVVTEVIRLKDNQKTEKN